MRNQTLRRRVVLVMLSAVAAGCVGTPPGPDRAGVTVELPPGDRPVQKVSLPSGARIRLLPATFGQAAPRPALDPRTVDGLWRVAMLQSARFDIAAGVESCASPARIRLHHDGDSNVFTTSLERDAQAPVALAAVRGAAPTAALDRLAYATRIALGEDLAQKPIQCAAAYSANPDCVRLTEEGLARRQAGNARAALELFQRARSHDGGCPLTLLHLAVEINRLGGEANANRATATVREALSFQHRLTPHVDHRLARAFFEIRRDDARLLELGREYQKTRPHDPHGRYTVALALEKSGKHAEALPLLRALRDRWPGNASVRYQLCFALLGSDDAESALEVLEEAKHRLPPGALVRPYAMALYHSGRHDELRRYLDTLRRSRGVAGTRAERELLRMEASHALLTGDHATAVRKLAESLAWVRRHSSAIAFYALDVAEDGEVLARLGAADVLAQAIDGFQQLGQLPASFANVLTYLGGLLDVDANRTPTRALLTLEKSHDTVWHSQLQAAVHHSRGELEAETRALERAVSSSKSPLLQASVARALDAAGKKSDSAKVAAYVRSQLLAFDQRRPNDHPLMTPGRAMAFLATSR